MTTSSDRLSAAAVDVGYGNLKVAGGFLGASQVDDFLAVLPVGAATADKAPRTMNGSISLHGGELVDLPDHTQWLAGVEPTLLSQYVRPTHTGFPKTDEYLALYFAALAKLAGYGHLRIKALVTGLPCEEFYRPGNLRSYLTGRLRGTHQIKKGLEVTVQNVLVIQQPVGAYAALVQDDRHRTGDEKILCEKDMTVLVVDAGFYSVDWVVVRGDEPDETTAGSSTLATSSILKDAASNISAAHDGALLSVDKLDSAYRNGYQSLHLGQKRVDYDGYIEAAGEERAKTVISQIASSMRMMKDVVNVVALTGGAAALYLHEAKKGFRNSTVTVIPCPVEANTRGYLGIARSQARLLEIARRRTAGVV